MTIYEELIKRVLSGESFHIDFQNRSMKIGKQYVIKTGEYDNSRKLFNQEEDAQCSMDLVLGVIDILYHRYKYSRPSERSDKKRRKYFKALSVDELTDEQLIVAERREVAQAQLEGFILCMVLENKFVWDDIKLGKWFYQSKDDQDLVILKKWIEKGE